MLKEMQKERNNWVSTAICMCIIIILTILVPACQRQEDSHNDIQVVRIRLKWLHQSQFAGFYVAQQKGFYQKSGVDVILNPGGIDFPAAPLVLKGSDHFGVTGADQIIKARENGAPLVAVAVIYNNTPFCLFAWEDNNVTSIGNMADKVVGVKYGGNEEFTYRAMIAKAFKKGELPPGSFIEDKRNIKLKNEVPVKYDLTPFLKGDVQVWPGYSINEPLLAKEKTGKEVSIITPNQYGLTLYADVLFTTEDMINNHADIVRKVVKATIQGWQYALREKNYEEVVGYVLRYANWSNRSHELNMLRASKPLIAPFGLIELGEMNEKDWNVLEHIMLEYKFLNKPIDITKSFTNQFLQ